MGLQVKLCDPCPSALEVVITMRYTNRRILYFTITIALNQKVHTTSNHVLI